MIKAILSVLIFATAQVFHTATEADEHTDAGGLRLEILLSQQVYDRVSH